MKLCDHGALVVGIIIIFSLLLKLCWHLYRQPSQKYRYMLLGSENLGAKLHWELDTGLLFALANRRYKNGFVIGYQCFVYFSYDCSCMC